METFAKLFERFLVFHITASTVSSFRGYLPLNAARAHRALLPRRAWAVPDHPQVLAKPEQMRIGVWWDAYARNHKIPVKKHEKGKSMEDQVRPHLRHMEARNITEFTSSSRDGEWQHVSIKDAQRSY